MRQLLIFASAAFAAGAGLYGQLTPEMLKPRKAQIGVQEYDDAKKVADAAIHAGRADEAVKVILPLTVAAPDDIDAWYILAKGYRLQGKLAAAEKTTQWMLDLRPEFIGGMWEAGLLREEYKDYEGALDLLNDVFHRFPVSKTPDQIEVLSDIARVLEKKDDKATAGLVRKEIARMKEMEAANAKAVAATVPQ